jgi:hypothetical protein
MRILRSGRNSAAAAGCGTDIGTRTIVVIRIDRVEVGGSPPLRRTLSGAEAP